MRVRACAIVCVCVCACVRACVRVRVRAYVCLRAARLGAVGVRDRRLAPAAVARHLRLQVRRVEALVGAEGGAALLRQADVARPAERRGVGAVQEGPPVDEVLERDAVPEEGGDAGEGALGGRGVAAPDGLQVVVVAAVDEDAAELVGLEGGHGVLDGVGELLVCGERQAGGQRRGALLRRYVGAQLSQEADVRASPVVHADRNVVVVPIVVHVEARQEGLGEAALRGVEIRDGS